MKVKVGSDWKDGQAWVKVGNAWKKAVAVWVKVGNTWESMTYKFKHVVLSDQKVKHDNVGGRLYPDLRWYQESKTVTATPPNFPIGGVEFYARYKSVARDTYVRLEITDDTERQRLLDALLDNKASVELHGPFVLTLDNSNSNINLLSGDRINLQPTNDLWMYNLLKAWEGKPLHVEINYND